MFLVNEMGQQSLHKPAFKQSKPDRIWNLEANGPSSYLQAAVIQLYTEASP